MRNRAALFLFLVAGWMVSGCRAQPDAVPAPPPNAPNKVPASLQVLVIGDSNTEIGYITGETARLMEERYGYFGSGYHSLNAVVGMGSGYLPHLKITNDASWQPYVMVPNNAAATKPYISPDGTAVRSSTPGAHTAVEFYGTGIDVYWLAEPDGGSFAISVDGGAEQTVQTGATALETRRTRLAKLPPGQHTMTLTVRTGKVTLLGVDACVDTPDARRAVVHKWGKGWAASGDFLDIDPQVFGSALKLLQPDIVVFLLGTNDHNLNGVNRDQFAANMTALSKRVRAVLPRSKILLVSTAQVNSPWSNSGLKQYVEIFPEVAADVGADFWDMSTWFGPWQQNDTAGLMLDAVHVNQKGGAKIATQLFEKLLDIAQKPSPPPAAPEKLTVTGQLAEKESPPLKIAGLGAWWAGDGQFALTPKGEVGTWNDLSGNHNDAAQQRKGHRPLRVANVLNGHPVVRFDGKSYLIFPTSSTIRTVIVVAKANTTGAALLGHPYFNTRPFSPGVVRPGKLLSANYAAPALLKGAAYVNGVQKPVGDDSADAIEPPLKDFQIISLVAQDNVAASYIGWGGSWNLDGYWNGDFAEVLIFNRALSDDERHTIEKYLSAKYAIALTN